MSHLSCIHGTCGRREGGTRESRSAAACTWPPRRTGCTSTGQAGPGLLTSPRRMIATGVQQGIEAKLLSPTEVTHYCGLVRTDDLKVQNK